MNPSTTEDASNVSYPGLSLEDEIKLREKALAQKSEELKTDYQETIPKCVTLLPDKFREDFLDKHHQGVEAQLRSVLARQMTISGIKAQPTASVDALPQLQSMLLDAMYLQKKHFDLDAKLDASAKQLLHWRKESVEADIAKRRGFFSMIYRALTSRREPLHEKQPLLTKQQTPLDPEVRKALQPDFKWREELAKIRGPAIKQLDQHTKDASNSLSLENLIAHQEALRQFLIAQVRAELEMCKWHKRLKEVTVDDANFQKKAFLQQQAQHERLAALEYLEELHGIHRQGLLQPNEPQRQDVPPSYESLSKPSQLAEQIIPYLIATHQRSSNIPKAINFKPFEPGHNYPSTYKSSMMLYDAARETAYVLAEPSPTQQRHANSKESAPIAFVVSGELSKRLRTTEFGAKVELPRLQELAAGEKSSVASTQSPDLDGKKSVKR
jgi:hypothetical protein